EGTRRAKAARQKCLNGRVPWICRHREPGPSKDEAMHQPSAVRLAHARRVTLSALLWANPYPISITASDARRWASFRMSDGEIATQPAVVVRPGRATWKKIALPRPFARRVKFWSRTKVRS